MYCQKCGQEQPDNARYCSNCGERLTQPIENDFRASYGYKEPEKPVATKSSALVCGIISIFFAGLILGVIAIILAMNEKQKHRSEAIFLGVLGIIGWAIFMALRYG